MFSPLGIPHAGTEHARTTQQRVHVLRTHAAPRSIGIAALYSGGSGTQPTLDSCGELLASIPLVERIYLTALLSDEDFQRDTDAFVRTVIARHNVPGRGCGSDSPTGEDGGTSAVVVAPWMVRALNIAYARGIVELHRGTDPSHYRYPDDTATTPLLCAVGLWAPMLARLDAQLADIAAYENSLEPTDVAGAQAVLGMYVHVLDSVVRPQRYAEQLLDGVAPARPAKEAATWQLVWHNDHTDIGRLLAKAAAAHPPADELLRLAREVPPGRYLPEEDEHSDAPARALGALRRGPDQLLDLAEKTFLDDAVDIIDRVCRATEGLLPLNEVQRAHARTIVYSHRATISLLHVHKAAHLALVWATALRHPEVPHIIAGRVVELMDATSARLDKLNQSFAPQTDFMDLFSESVDSGGPALSGIPGLLSAAPGAPTGSAEAAEPSAAQASGDSCPQPTAGLYTIGDYHHPGNLVDGIAEFDATACATTAQGQHTPTPIEKDPLAYLGVGSGAPLNAVRSYRDDDYWREYYTPPLKVSHLTGPGNTDIVLGCLDELLGAIAGNAILSPAAPAQWRVPIEQWAHTAHLADPEELASPLTRAAFAAITGAPAASTPFGNIIDILYGPKSTMAALACTPRAHARPLQGIYADLYDRISEREADGHLYPVAPAEREIPDWLHDIIATTDPTTAGTIAACNTTGEPADPGLSSIAACHAARIVLSPQRPGKPTPPRPDLCHPLIEAIAMLARTDGQDHHSSQEEDIHGHETHLLLTQPGGFTAQPVDAQAPTHRLRLVARSLLGHITSTIQAHPEAHLDTNYDALLRILAHGCAPHETTPTGRDSVRTLLVYLSNFLEPERPTIPAVFGTHTPTHPSGTYPTRPPEFHRPPQAWAQVRDPLTYSGHRRVLAGNRLRMTPRDPWED